MTVNPDRGFRPGLWPTIFTIFGLVLLVGLGTWQIQRLAWKTDLLADIAQRSAADPVPLPAELDDLTRWRYRPVTVTGRFDHAAEMAVHAGRGYHIITPLIRLDGGSPVLVVRGEVPPDGRDPDSRPDGQESGVVSVTGIVRLPSRPGLFVPKNDPQANLWYWRDLPAMAAHAGLQRVAPVFVEATQTAKGGWPRGGVTNYTISNNHLSYVITWYGLALALLAIYLVFGWRRPPSETGAKTGVKR
ncbi:SURF1 family protein [Iodidimonas gelatinilytica]|nr:SURF1 family protein [Iodidimonas gelatinilytica]